MGIRKVRELSCTPNPTSIPGAVVLEYAARPTGERTAVDTVYLIDSSVPVFFENRDGSLTNTATLPDTPIGPATTAVPFRTRLAWGSAGPAPASFRIRAMVSENGAPGGFTTNCIVHAAGAVRWAALFARGSGLLVTRSAGAASPGKKKNKKKRAKKKD